MRMGNAKPSSWHQFPTPTEPLNKMKYASIDILLDEQTKTWNRQTYSFFDFLGDMGGLYDCLKILITVIIAPFNAITHKVELMKAVFVKKDPKKQKIESRGCLSIYFIGCFFNRDQTRRYKKMLMKS